MHSLAMNRHQGSQHATLCVLAVEPDANQALILEQTLDGHIPGRLVVVKSTQAALDTLVDAIPDLVLVSPLLPPRTEDQFMEHLRVLGVDASQLQLLSIPRFATSAFADEVTAYLTRLSESRTDGRVFAAVRDVPPIAQPPGVRLEHIEHLLERLQADEQAPPEQLITDDSGEAMPTAHEPRFLTLDQQISPQLRAVLDEADGCLKMAFLTGGGACAVRALDVLLSEQGIVGTERAHQLRDLGKKHPAVAESFLRILLQAMNDTGAIWDIKRLTLAIVLLKAIAHEIYVLGPERTERASYVLGLVERFNAGVKGGSAA